MGSGPPHGSWWSPLQASAIAAASTSVLDARAGLDDVWWAESRPTEGGRVAIVRHRPGGGRSDVLPAPWSARSRVHTYGGGAWWLHDDALFFVEDSDQRIYRLGAGSSVPRALTPEPDTPRGTCYADGVVTRDGRWIVCVRQRPGSDAPSRSGVGEGAYAATGHAGSEGEGVEDVNEIVAVPAHDGGAPVVLVTGPDFVSFPRVSLDGSRLCWTQWDHPRMPWDGTELWVAELHEGVDGISLGGAQRLMGGPDESVQQPTWAPDGSLLVVSDRSGWWNLYSLEVEAVRGEERIEPRHLAPMEADVGQAQWVFDQSRFALLPDGRVVIASSQAGFDRMHVFDPARDRLDLVDQPNTSISSVRAFGGGALAVVASPTSEPHVVVMDIPDPGKATIAPLSPTGRQALDGSWMSRPEAIEFPTSGGVAHALFYRPTNPGMEGAPQGLPPLIVTCHGGPTSAARTQLNLTYQYWTSRGLAVVDVDYRGSVGYGREYRRALEGGWGVLDVADCEAAAKHLIEAGEVDPDRIAIRGSSAGGLTALMALVTQSTWSAGASLYGISDLERLAMDTHKFEARYMDSLVGPYPEERDVYVQRSPITHVADLSCPVILFQGADDVIVPPSQSQVVADALEAKGLPVRLHVFEGEGHGFRRAETIEAVLEAELGFYADVFGFSLAEGVTGGAAAGA